MKRRLSHRESRLLLSIVCGLACLPAAPAQSIAPSSPSAPASLTVVSAPSAPAAGARATSSPEISVVPPSRARAVSPETAARLAATAPKYVPPKVREESDVAAQSAPPENDKPKNGIVRLPDYVVREAPPPTFKYRELLTVAGKLDLAYKRRPGLRLGSLPFLSNNGVALAMLEEDFALERAAELKELFGLLPTSDRPTPVKQNTKGVGALVGETRE